MKRNVIMLAALFTGAVASVAQETMKIEMKNGTVVAYNVEDINRFYFEKAEEPIAQNCEVGITDKVVMTDCASFEFSYGTAVEQVYAGYFKPADIAQWSDEDIVEVLKRNVQLATNGGVLLPKTANQIGNSNLAENTDYVLAYVAFNAAGKRGSLYLYPYKTKAVATQPVVTINSVKYDNDYFYVNVSIDNTTVKDYYILQNIGTDLQPINVNMAVLGLIWKQQIATDPQRGLYTTDGTFRFARNGGNSIQFYAWAQGYDGEFSGIITGDTYTAQAGSRELIPMKPTETKQPNVAIFSEKDMIDIIQQMHTEAE